MKRIGYSLVACTLALAFAASVAAAGTPTPNGAAINMRVFNDCPTSIAGNVNAYPASILFNETNVNCVGGINLHTWSYSSDGGATPAEFDNNSCFSIGATMVISGTSQVEGGLRLSPWWSPHADGFFNVKANFGGGEIAVFGGRLPFYSFTANHGLNYAAGTPIRLEMYYDPNSLTAGHPAAIEYRVIYGGSSYSSGALAFDQGNAGEDPPHGLWGILSPAYAGGRFQHFTNTPGSSAEAMFTDITFGGCTTPAKSSTWGNIKATYR